MINTLSISTLMVTAIVFSFIVGWQAHGVAAPQADLGAMGTTTNPNGLIFDFRVLDMQTGKWHYASPDKPWGYSGWQQYTGINDKKGKKIYVGDQVVFDEDRGKIWRVEYIAPRFIATSGGASHVINVLGIEVIGNAYP